MSTMAGKKVYICTTPQPNDLNQAAFEALAYIPIGKVGNMDAVGTDTNVVSYDTWDTDVSDKDKGISNAGDPTLECKRVATDPGQLAVKAAALTRYKYAVKIEMSDAPDANHTNSIIYNRGIVTGPSRPQGRNEDFELEVYKFGFVQREIEVLPQAI